MKKISTLIILIVLLMISCAAYSQKGFLGKRFLFNFDTRLSPAWSNPDFNGDKGLTKFNINFMPGAEFVINNDWTVGANYQFFESKFIRKNNDFIGYNEILCMEGIGNVKVSGIGIYGKRYHENNAPLGYYTKVQLDLWTYEAKCLAKTNSEFLTSSGKPKPYKANSGMFGFRVELGKTIVIGKYFSLGTGISFGTTTKGYVMLVLDDEHEVNPIDWAERRLRLNYMFGLNMSIGIIPF